MFAKLVVFKTAINIASGISIVAPFLSESPSFSQLQVL